MSFSKQKDIAACGSLLHRRSASRHQLSSSPMSIMELRWAGSTAGAAGAAPADVAATPVDAELVPVVSMALSAPPPSNSAWSSRAMSESLRGRLPPVPVPVPAVPCAPMALASSMFSVPASPIITESRLAPVMSRDTATQKSVHRMCPPILSRVVVSAETLAGSFASATISGWSSATPSSVARAWSTFASSAFSIMVVSPGSDALNARCTRASSLSNFDSVTGALSTANKTVKWLLLPTTHTGSAGVLK
mmetsp:Transcript_59266/g.163666  ORF Transcript_59266/g.163666 Transcript_59266/m.163666 type:complete len:249 (-) Transcript_59266:559-1305(-)